MESTNGRFIGASIRAANWLAPRLGAALLARTFLTPRRFPTPDRERSWIEGAARLDVSDGQGSHLHVMTWGQGPTVLLVHGWEGRGSQLGLIAHSLVEAGFRVVAFDAPGHGRSSGKQSSIVDFARAIERIAEWTGPVTGVIAHSLGGAALLQALRRGLEVDRVVLISVPENPGRFLDRMGAYLGLPQSIVIGAQRHMERRFGVEWPEFRGKTIAPSQTADLLVIHDRRDAEVRWEEARRLAEAWPGAALVTTEELGHRRILRDPDVARTVTEFVSEGVSTPAKSLHRLDRHQPSAAVEWRDAA